MSFKVTLRKNGRPVGEMCYSSEAVAVSQAAAMQKAAPGTAATVAPAKANRRRRNPAKAQRASLRASEAALEMARATSTAMLRKIALNEIAHADADTRRAARIILVERGERLNPRRNGGSVSVMWTVRVGSQEIGDIHAPPKVTAALVRKAAKLATMQGITASMFKRFGSLSDGMTRHSVTPFLKNGHICRNPGCDCRSNPAEFGFDENFRRLMMRDGHGWTKAPHHKGGSPRAFLAQIEALVADGSMSTGTAALLRQQMRNAGFTTGAEVEFAAYVPKSRRRKNPRNGTWSAERMAAISQRAQFGRR